MIKTHIDGIRDTLARDNPTGMAESSSTDSTSVIAPAHRFRAFLRRNCGAVSVLGSAEINSNYLLVGKEYWREKMKPLTIGILVCIFLLFANMPARAEPPIQMSPVTRELLKGVAIVAGAIDKLINELNPSCSHALQQCWVARGMDKDNLEQVQDACWMEVSQCPQACKDRYFSYRESGIKSAIAEEMVLFSEPPCFK